MSDIERKQVENKRFEVILPIITAELISFIMKEDSLGEDDAINRLYATRLYELLENEKTKVWQYSTYMLLELYNREKAGELILPEV